MPARGAALDVTAKSNSYRGLRGRPARAAALAEPPSAAVGAMPVAAATVSSASPGRGARKLHWQTPRSRRLLCAFTGAFLLGVVIVPAGIARRASKRDGDREFSWHRSSDLLKRMWHYRSLSNAAASHWWEGRCLKLSSPCRYGGGPRTWLGDHGHNAVAPDPGTRNTIPSLLCVLRSNGTMAAAMTMSIVTTQDLDMTL